MNSKEIEFIQCRLDDIAEIHNYKRRPLNSRERELMQGQYPYYGASGIFDYLNDYIFDGEYVLISEDGENLKSRKTPIAFKADGKFWVNNHAHILKGKENLVNDFIVYYFANLDINPFVTGAVQPKLNKENLLSIPIFMPKEPEIRNQLTCILKTIDQKIKNNIVTNLTLDDIAQTLFKEWFTNFNYPTTNELQNNSEVGEMPQGWRIGKLEDIAKQIKDSINPSSYPEKEFHHYSLPAFDADELPSVDLGGSILSNKTTVKKYSVLFSKLNPRIPRIWSICNIEEEKSICSTEFIGFIPKQDFCFSYLNYFLKQPELITKLTGIATGTSNSHQRIKPSDLLELSVLVPDDDTVRRFDKIVRPILEIRFHKILENQQLKKTRDALLPKLMSGEIKLNG